MHVSDADIEQRSDQADKQHAGISPDNPEYVDIVKSFLQHAGKWNFKQCGNEPGKNAGTNEHTVTSKQSTSGICF